MSLLATSASAQPGFQPAWSTYEATGVPASSFRQPVTLPPCQDGDDVFLFDSDWESTAQSLGYCTSGDDIAQCMSQILNDPNKRIFCFEPGDYLTGDDSAVLLYTSGHPSAPRIIQPVDGSIRWEDRTRADEVVLKTSLHLIDADHWILSSVTLSEDHWWLQAHKPGYDWDGIPGVEAGTHSRRRYFCGPDETGYGYAPGLAQEGHTLNVHCSSNNVFDRLRILNSQAPGVRIAFASHENLLQNSLIGYTADVAAPWIAEGQTPIEFFRDLDEEVRNHSDTEDAEKPYHTVRIYDPSDENPSSIRSHAMVHRQHGHILQDHYCVTLSPWQDRPGRTLYGPGLDDDGEEYTAHLSIQFVRDNHIVDNEFVNCNDAIQLATKPAAGSVRGGGFHRYAGTVIQGNDMYVEPELYTDCNGGLPGHPAGPFGHDHWRVQQVCSTAENAIDIKGGGGLFGFQLKDFVLIDSNRMWGYRHIDRRLGKYDLFDATSHDPWVDGLGTRAANGAAIVAHLDTSHVLFTRNLFFNSATGLRQDSDRRTDDRAQLYYAAINNLFFDILSNPLPEILPRPTTPDTLDFATAAHHESGATAEWFFDPDWNPAIWRTGNPDWTDGWFAAALIFYNPFDLYLNSVVHSHNWHEAGGLARGRLSTDSKTQFICNAITRSGPGGVYYERRYCDRCSGEDQAFGNLPVWATVEDNAFFASGTLPAPPPCGTACTPEDWAPEWNDAVSLTLPTPSTHVDLRLELKRITRKITDLDLYPSRGPTHVDVPNGLLRKTLARPRCDRLRDYGVDIDAEAKPFWLDAWNTLISRE